MLTQSKTEKERLYDWASQFSDRQRKQIFTEFLPDLESYWNIRKNSKTYLMEYGPKTLMDFSEHLQKMWVEDEAMQEILKTVLVTIMKNEPIVEQGQVQSEKKQGELPEYIYNF